VSLRCRIAASHNLIAGLGHIITKLQRSL